MATRKATRSSLSPFYVTSTYLLDVEVAPEFAQNLTITQIGSRNGNAIYRLSADPKGGKLCVNVPKVGEVTANDCGDPSLRLLLDGKGKASDPWRVKLGRAAHAKRKKEK